MKTESKSTRVLFSCVLGVALAAAATISVADTHIEKNGTRYIVKSNAAASVCNAVVRDSPTGLKVAMEKGLSGKTRLQAHTFYSCNKMNLLAFAEDIQSHKVSAYLRPKFERNSRVTTEEMAGR